MAKILHNSCISIEISLKFVSEGLVCKKSRLVFAFTPAIQCHSLIFFTHVDHEIIPHNKNLSNHLNNIICVDGLAPYAARLCSEGITRYIISHEIITRFCYVLFYSDYIIVSGGSIWVFHPYSSGLLHWHWGNHMIAPVPVKQPWRIWIKSINT